jgi:diacylglycerol O-acyltransferase / wax synthase
VQLIGTVSLAVGAMSYSGQFTIMAVADQDAYPDLDVFAAGVRDDLNTLALSTGVTTHRLSTPGALGRRIATPDRGTTD